LLVKCDAGAIAHRVHAETYLRLECERFLVKQTPVGLGHHKLDPMAEAAAAARALISAGSLDEDTANSVFDEYDLALCVRGRQIKARHWGDTSLASEKVELSASRTVVGPYPVGKQSAELVLHEVRFADDATYVELSWASAQNINPIKNWQTPPPRSVIIADDRGATAQASPGRSGHSVGSWEATFVTEKALSPATTWLEIDGERVALPPPGRPTAVRTEPVAPPADPFKAMLFRELMDTLDRRVVEAAVAALVATGSLSGDDPMLAEVEQLAEALSRQRAVDGLPEPWASMFGRVGKHDGPVGFLPIGAAVNTNDGWSARFDSLFSEAEKFRVTVAASPPRVLLSGGRAMVPLLGGHVDPLRTDAVAIEWGAEDDVGNSYLAVARFGGGGSRGVVEGELLFRSPLDPRARSLSLLATGLRERAIVTVPLEGLEANDGGH
jgi:hypothetical protein